MAELATILAESDQRRAHAEMMGTLAGTYYSACVATGVPEDTAKILTLDYCAVSPQLVFALNGALELEEDDDDADHG